MVLDYIKNHNTIIFNRGVLICCNYSISIKTSYLQDLLNIQTTLMNQKVGRVIVEHGNFKNELNENNYNLIITFIKNINPSNSVITDICDKFLNSKDNNDIIKIITMEE